MLTRPLAGAKFSNVSVSAWAADADSRMRLNSDIRVICFMDSSDLLTQFGHISRLHEISSDKFCGRLARWYQLRGPGFPEFRVRRIPRVPAMGAGQRAIPGGGVGRRVRARALYPHTSSIRRNQHPTKNSCGGSKTLLRNLYLPV